MKPGKPSDHHRPNPEENNKLLSILVILLVIFSAMSVAFLTFKYLDSSINLFLDADSGKTNPLAEQIGNSDEHLSDHPESEYPDLLYSSSDSGASSTKPIISETPNPIIPKSIVASSAQRERWTATPLPTSTPRPSPTPIPTFVGAIPSGSIIPTGLRPQEKWIDVNLTTQTLVAYEGSKPVFQSLVSTGTGRNPTVTGQFRIWLRFAAQDMNGYRLGFDYYLKNVPFVQYFYQDYALHGTYWHNNFGTPMSHGCVNLPTPAAEWLFDWASNGTLVNIHS